MLGEERKEEKLKSATAINPQMLSSSFQFCPGVCTPSLPKDRALFSSFSSGEASSLQ